MKENWETHWKDYYKILQVHPSAEQEVVKAAHDRLARKYHPDVNKEPIAHERMKDINEGFEILSNLEKRQRYHLVWLQKTAATRSGLKHSVHSPESAKEESPASSSSKGEATVPPVNHRHGWLLWARWLLISSGVVIFILNLAPLVSPIPWDYDLYVLLIIPPVLVYFGVELGRYKRTPLWKRVVGYPMLLISFFMFSFLVEEIEQNLAGNPTFSSESENLHIAWYIMWFIGMSFGWALIHWRRKP